MYMKKVMFIALVYFILAQTVTAVSFVATVSPPVINSSVSTPMQLNITNLDPINNITQINLTLPGNFSFVSCLDGCILEGSTLSWSKEVQSNTSYNFIFSIRADVNGTRNFNVITLDSANNTMQNYTNNFEVNDTTPPQWSNVWPGSTSVVYSPDATYYFNITWSDNVALNKVVFFFGSNTTTFDAVGNLYSTSVRDLKTGNYTYYWYANDTNGNSAQTSSFIFNITKAPNPLNVYLNSNLNQNISITNNTTLTISVTASHGNLTIYQTGPENSTTRIYEPVSMNITLSLKLGLYNFTFVNTGNENYSSNSSTYFVLVTPNYTATASTPSAYSSSSSTFTVSFSSPPVIDSLLIEGSWSGTRYAMTNSSLTTYSYSIVLPAGSFYWQVYANVSGYIFPLTDRNSFSIPKATPSIYISASPSWTVQSGTQTTVSCTAVVPVKLYRNATQVSNPDVQTLQIGTYIYSCVSEETQNYTSSSESAILTITQQPFADLAFVQVPDLIFVEQNSSNSTQVIVRNTGNIQQTVNFTIENISVGSWSVSPTSMSLSPGSNGTFSINFTITNESVGSYTGIFKAYSINKTIVSNFTLRITLGKEAKENINKTIEGFKLELLALEIELNNTKSMGFNVSSAEEILNTVKQLISQAEDNVAKGDYEGAARILSNIGNLPTEIRKELERVKTSKGLPSFTIYIIVGVAIGVGCILAYLLWPTEIVSEKKPEVQEKKSFLERLKNIFVRKKKYEYREK
jgi:hypothetical protein